MVVWSSVVRPLTGINSLRSLLNNSGRAIISQNAFQQIRNMSGHGPRTMPITPSRFQWHKFKDMLHYYIMVGAIPALALVFYTNVFIGPATLSEIPEGYVPKHWEYHKHPISRFLSRYVYPSPQQEYEKMCHYIFVENEKAQIRKLEEDVRNKMGERNDYQAYYYRPAIAKYHRISKEAAEYIDSIRGDN